MSNYECPLCGLDFEEENCHSTCPMSKGCAMVSCPRCSYEFVQDGSLASLVRRFFKRRSSDATSPR